MAKFAKSPFAIFGAAALALLVLFAGANLISSKVQPTFKVWQAKMIKSCEKMIAQNNAAFLKIFPQDREPTLEDFIAFKKYFEPDFRVFATYVKTQERPAEMALEVDDFVKAVGNYESSIQKSATDVKAAKVEFAAGGQTEAVMNFGKTASILGLEKCVG